MHHLLGVNKYSRPYQRAPTYLLLTGGSPFVDPPNVCSLFVVDHTNPANQASPYGKLADLTASHFGLDDATVHDGKIYGVHGRGDSRTRDQLWRLNPDNWTDVTSPYGNRGQLPHGIAAADSAVSHNGNLYVFDASDHELWHVNPSSPGSTSGSYGRKGPLEDSTHSPFASASIDNKLILIDRGGELWNVNPESPSSTAGSYGNIGEVPGPMDIWSGTAHTIV